MSPQAQLSARPARGPSEDAPRVQDPYGRALASIEKHHRAVLVLLVLLSAGAAILSSGDKPLWLDEYFSLHTELLASPGAIWRYLRTSPMALDPPIYHWLSYYPVHLLGGTALAARFVSIFAYSIFTACIFTLLRKWTNAMSGLFAVLLALSTALFDYAFEARPYSLMLAAGAAALLTWYWTENGNHRKLALAGLAVCIAVSVLNHYFGCLIAAPIAAGELVRWFRRRRIAFGVPFALFAGGSCGLLCLPLLAPAKRFDGKSFYGVGLESIFNTYKILLEPAAATLALIVIVVALACFVTPRLTGIGARDIELDRASATAVVCFAAFPVFAYIFAAVVTHTFVPRYALPGGIGLVLLAALALGWAGRQRPMIWGAAVLAAMIFPSARAASQLRHAIHNRGGVRPTSLAVRTNEPDLPIVIGTLERGFQIADQTADTFRRRCVILTDPAEARIIGDSADIFSVEGMRRNPTVRIRFQDYATFVSEHPRFLILGSVFGRREWVVRKVMEDHGTVRLEGHYGYTEVYSADMSGAQ